MEVHTVLIELLKEQDVDTIFTYLSEDIMRFMSVVDGDSGYDVDILHSRHEQAAIAMADGYYRTNGEIGVAIVGRGPAIAHTGTALTTARKNNSNVVVIVPETPQTLEYDIKEFDQTSYLKSTVGNVVSVSSMETLITDVKEGFRQARVGNGPVAVQIPWDILDGKLDKEKAEIETAITRSTSGMTKQTPRLPDEELVEEAVDMYLDADAFQPPVILAGQGAVRADAREAIEELAERTNALLATSLQARDYFDGHPYNIGVSGSWGTNLASQYLNETDFVFAVGCSLNAYTLDKGYLLPDDATIVHIDTDVRSINRYEEVDLGIVGDAEATVSALVDELDRLQIHREDELWTDRLREEIAAHSRLDGKEYPEKPNRMDPRELMQHIDQLLPDDRVVVSDAGHLTRWIADGISAPPEDLILTLDFAAIGLGLPMGLGTAQAAGEDRACITFCGDGGFLMSLQELETAVRHDLPVLVVIINDESLGSEYHTLEVSGYPGDVSLLSTPCLGDVARSIGAEAYTVESIDELHEIADEITEAPEGPTVVECRVDHEVRHRSKL